MARLVSILLPDDPVRAQAIRAWAAEKGLEYRWKEKNGGNRSLSYPRTCKNGHRLYSNLDEIVSESNGRVFRYCKQCRQETWAKNNARKTRKESPECPKSTLRH